MMRIGFALPGASSFELSTGCQNWRIQRPPSVPGPVWPNSEVSSRCSAGVSDETAGDTADISGSLRLHADQLHQLLELLRLGLDVLLKLLGRLARRRVVDQSLRGNELRVEARIGEQLRHVAVQPAHDR